MKELFRTFLLSSISFGVIMGMFFSLIFWNLTLGIITGLASGVLFGLTISIFAYIQTSKFKKDSSSITNGAAVIYCGGANHFKGKEAVGGFLYLTKDELIFKSHNLNFQSHETRIEIRHIENIKKVNTLGLIPNGMMIVSNDGICDRFVVNNRKKWLAEIEYQKGILVLEGR